jgi:aminopeptidase N
MTGTPRRLGRPAVTAALAVVLTGGLTACITQAGTATVPPTPVPSAAGATTAPPPTPAALNAGLSTPEADPLYPAYGNPDLDVLSYQLTLAWSPPTRVLTGTATLIIRPTTDVTELSLDFVDSYTVDGASVDGVAQRSRRRDNDIVVPAGRTLAKDSRTTLVVRYHGTPHQIAFPSDRGDAGEGLGLRPTADGGAWTMQEPYGAATWFPVNDHPSDEAIYNIAVTVPTGWTAIASGTPGPVDSAAKTVTYHYASTYPVASYVTTLVIGKYTKVAETSSAGVPINCWLRTGRDDAFKPAAADMPELMSWLTDRFGPYPFPTAGVVVVDSSSAMETQQMITYGGRDDFEFTTQEIEETLLHELSHQWFGDAVTPTNWLGLWLNEGWAMYAEWMWTVDQGMLTDGEWVTNARSSDARSRPVAGPPGHPKVGHFAEINVYLGPALMLRELRKAVGDTEFFAMARDWVQTQLDKSVDRAGFIAFVNKHTGKDFTKLLNTWLDSATTPPST